MGPAAEGLRLRPLTVYLGDFVQTPPEGGSCSVGSAPFLVAPGGAGANDAETGRKPALAPESTGSRHWDGAGALLGWQCVIGLETLLQPESDRVDGRFRLWASRHLTRFAPSCEENNQNP